MPLPLSCRRCFVLTCLTLGALCALPVLADTPAASAAPTVQAAAQRIVLQNVLASDVHKQMHWDQPVNLPAGVRQIVTLPMQNALLVTATPAGLAQVREIVKALDIEPRQVEVRVALAHAPEASLSASGIDFNVAPQTAPATTGAAPVPVLVLYRYAAGSAAARFLQKLTEQGEVTQVSALTTANNASASMSFSAEPQAAESQAFTVVPRINGDNSVTLALGAKILDSTAKYEVHARRTVPSGETMLVVTPPATPDEKSLLLLVTPTALK